MSPAAAGAMFWIATALCLVAQVALLRSAFRSPMPQSPESRVALPRRSVEIIWTIVPAIALAFVLLATWRAMHRPPAHDMVMPAGHRMIEE